MTDTNLATASYNDLCGELRKRDREIRAESDDYAVRSLFHDWVCKCYRSKDDPDRECYAQTMSLEEIAEAVVKDWEISTKNGTEQWRKMRALEDERDKLKEEASLSGPWNAAQKEALRDDLAEAKSKLKEYWAPLRAVLRGVDPDSGGKGVVQAVADLGEERDKLKAMVDSQSESIVGMPDASDYSEVVAERDTLRGRLGELYEAIDRALPGSENIPTDGTPEWRLVTLIKAFEDMTKERNNWSALSGRQTEEKGNLTRELNALAKDRDALAVEKLEAMTAERDKLKEEDWKQFVALEKERDELKSKLEGLATDRKALMDAVNSARTLLSGWGPF